MSPSARKCTPLRLLIQNQAVNSCTEGHPSLLTDPSPLKAKAAPLLGGSCLETICSGSICPPGVTEATWSLGGWCVAAATRCFQLQPPMSSTASMEPGSGLAGRAKKVGWLMDRNKDRYRRVFVILTIKQLQIKAFVSTHSSEWNHCHIPLLLLIT